MMTLEAGPKPTVKLPASERRSERATESGPRPRKSAAPTVRNLRKAERKGDRVRVREVVLPCPTDDRREE
jgi:hypothetical protein